MGATGIIPLEERLAADTFGKSYREFLALKPSSFRWGRLAPQGAAQVGQALEENWSDEKLADYLNCDAAEAAACRKRYVMSKKINAPAEAAERFRRAAFEWIGEVAELDEATRKRLAGDLARLIGNQLFVSAQAGEDVMELSRELAEGGDLPSGKPTRAGPPRDRGERGDRGERPGWGPQWKD